MPNESMIASIGMELQIFLVNSRVASHYSVFRGRPQNFEEYFVRAELH